MAFWESDLTEQESAELIENVAQFIEKRRMTTPAIMALEMHKPLANVGGNASIVFAPFMVPLFGFEGVNNYSRLLKSSENIERLIRRLEAPPLPKDEAVEAKDNER